MTALIDRQAAIDAMGVCFENKKRTWKREVTTGEKAIFLDMIGVVNAVPSAEPERKRGKWKKEYADYEAFGVRPFYRYCSVCNKVTVFPYKYCPNCGADMRDEE